MRLSVTRPVHIWLPALTSSTGGIQAYAQTFLDAYAQAGIAATTEVFIKNEPAVSTFPSGAGMTLHGLGAWPDGHMRTLAFAVRLLWSAWRQRPGLIIVGHANFVRLAVWARRFLGIPFWCIVYGIDVTWESGVANAARLVSAERIISISRYTRDCLIDGHGLPPERFSLLPTTFDDERFRIGARSAEVLDKFGLPSDNRLVLTICRLDAAEGYKGYDQILRAMPAVLRAVPRAHYLLGGRGDDLPRIRQLITDLGLEDAVTLAGFVPDEELVAFYQTCDLFAMPSRKEGFGIVFIEALSCGRPVLAGNRDGSVDALLDGELGVLVDPENPAEIAAAMIGLLNGQHPHPLVFQPDELRCRVIAAYGPKKYAETLATILDKYLPANVRNV